MKGTVNFLIVGLGSIGRKHLSEVSKIYPSSKLFVIDPLLAPGEHSLNGISFQVLLRVEESLTDSDIGIISNWGPDHFKTINQLIAASYKRIIVEKPLADSLNEILQIQEICIKEEIVLTVNHSWHFEQLGNRINVLSDSLTLGPPVMLSITGGARCLSTAGSHLIHLSNQIFGSIPSFIAGLGGSSFINPRNSSLSYYEGVFSFKYPKGQLLSISYCNSSSIEGETKIYWRDAMGDLRGENITIYERTRDRDYLDKITRYGQPTELIFEGELPRSNSLEFRDVYEFVEKCEFSRSKSNLSQHIDSSLTLIQALLSSHLGFHTAPFMKHDEKTSAMKFGIS